MAGIAFLFSPALFATDLTWTGTSDNYWTNAGNWNPPQVPKSSDHVFLNSGSVTVPASATFSNMDWTGGSIGGALTVASNASLTISGSATKTLYSFGSITNAGTVLWGGTGDVRHGSVCGCSGAIENLPGGLFELQSDQTLGNDGYGGLSFHNAGLLRKSAGSGTTSVEVPFSNDGTVEADTGTIRFSAGGHLNGMFVAGTGAAVTFAGGTFTLDNGSLGSSGAGQVQFTDGAYLTFSVPISNFNLGAGLLTGNNTVAGALNWTGGSVGGALTVASNASLTISGSATKTLYSFGSITNAGTVLWGGTGDVRHGSVCGCSGAIENLPGGLFELQSDQTLGNDGYGGLSFHNAGLLRKSAGSGTTSVEVPFANDGTIAVDRGTLNFQAGFSNSAPADLVVSLGGTTPGTGFGRLQFASALALVGSFGVTTRNGYLPSPGDTFQVLSYPSSTGAFTCFTGLDLGGGLLLQPQFDPTSLALVTTTYATNSNRPQLFIAPAPGGLLVTWPMGYPDWTLLSTTNLVSPFWSPLPSPCGNQAVVPVVAPRQYFRLNRTN